MTEQDKQLLLKVLCAMLPYGLECCYHDDIDDRFTLSDLDNSGYANESYPIEDIKPFLRPMESMTEEERGVLWWATYCDDPDITEQSQRHIDWLNAHHFDHCGLIEKGLALPAPEGMYEV